MHKFSRLMKEMAEIIVFLGFLFGLLYVLLIVSDPNPLLSSMKYYFWMLAPLVVFGLVFGFVSSVRKVYFPKRAKADLASPEARVTK